MDPIPPSFERDRHVRFFSDALEALPSDYEEQEINRITLAYFVVSALHILDALDRVDRDRIARWVLSLRRFPEKKTDFDDGQFYGFHGSRSSQFPNVDSEAVNLNGSHLASTYCAIAILKMIGYDLSSIDSESISVSMRNLQQPDGSFMPFILGAETDLRFVYCAASICYMLNDWSGMDKKKATEYIIKCQSYDGGFGLLPGSESHGGATYCAVAALQLMGLIRNDFLSKPMLSSVIDVPSLLQWCVQRQIEDGGFQGRRNKPSDTCYAFWVGGVLSILGTYDIFDKCSLRSFLLTCQTKYGGFSKFPGQLPDLYHSYFGVCAFSMLREVGLRSLCVELGIPDGTLLGI
ncbi:Protein farnesyltransferase subunit beta [Acorus calamus]|uniref:Geranylgeranyl transferase type-1 subunit beta n=1 Tax=Acorus calamus TaxID=4465 RepID=A0AAV9DBN2_ACOCL|nr:Protein farnesyltransferase subunit beta [Acorus calamus]